MLKSGMYERVITPPLGSSIPGYLRERKGSDVKDELYVKACIIETEDVTLAFISVDALCVLPPEVEAIRKRVQAYTGIAPENMMISATHTHTGPPIRPGLDGDENEAYLAELAEKAADTAILAYQRRRPAEIRIGVGEESGISFNRRFWMKDGSFQTNPGFLNPDIDHPAGPIDPEVLVMRIDGEDGVPIGVITNFACHTDTVSGTEYSADFPGEMSKGLKQALGDHVVSLFMLGACGDINHIDVSKPRPDISYHYKKMGRVLAGEVLKTFEISEAWKPAKPVVKQTKFDLELRQVTAEEIAEAEKILADANASSNDHFFANRTIQASKETDKTREIEIQTFAFGNAAFVGLPGEIFVKLGLEIKEKAPFEHTFMNTLCNNSIYGYVCTREAYEQGGYEPRLALSRVPKDAGEKFVDKAVQMLNGGDK